MSSHEEKEEHLPSPLHRPTIVSRFSARGLRTDQGSIHRPVQSFSFVCGLLAGVAQAAVFNPYDRALYLSIKERRNFLSWSNWKAPYNGFLQSLGGRAVAGGLYFPLEHLFLRALDPLESGPLLNFIAGTSAGAVNAIVLNPLSAIKYKTWGRETNRGMFREAKIMWEKANGSPRPFFNGIRATLYRDVVFGGCYTWLRLQMQVWFDLPPAQQWKANLVAAAMATVASGPFNYVRNIQYSTSARQKALSTTQILQEFWLEVRQQPTFLKQVGEASQLLRIGWGTMRVALGMSFGHFVYDQLQHQLSVDSADDG